jgi:hypothetical protein
MLRVPFICALFALPWLMPGRAAAGVAKASPLVAAGSGALVTRFRFDAGAPLSAPAGVAVDGTLCVGTVDGYIHALAPDGSYRWSYSMHGAVVRRPLFVGSLWYIATSAQRIAAITREGALAWVWKPPSPIVSELAADASGLAYFIAEDHFLYGITAHGGVSLRAPFGTPQAGPSPGSDGAVWALNQAGNVVRAQDRALRRFEPSAAPPFDFGAPNTLQDPAGQLWQVMGGALAISATQDAEPHVFALGTSALFTPAWSSVGNYAVVSARSGLVMAIDPPRVRQAR